MLGKAKLNAETHLLLKCSCNEPNAGLCILIFISESGTELNEVSLYKIQEEMCLVGNVVRIYCSIKILLGLYL